MADRFSRRQLSQLLWALVLLGLISSASIAAYVGWNLTTLSEENASGRATLQSLQLDLEQLRRLSTEAHTATQNILLEQSSLPSQNRRSVLKPLHQHISKMAAEGTDSALVGALRSFDQQVSAMTTLWRRTLLWH